MGALKTQEDVTFHRERIDENIWTFKTTINVLVVTITENVDNGIGTFDWMARWPKKRKKGDRLFWTTGPEPADQKSRVPPWTFRRGYKFNPVGEKKIVPPLSLPVDYLMMCWWNKAVDILYGNRACPTRKWPQGKVQGRPRAPGGPAHHLLQQAWHRRTKVRSAPNMSI